MRRLLVAAAAVTGSLLWTPTADAQTRGGQFEGFGGMTIGSTTSAPTFGASIAAPLGDHLQVVGEAGRLSDVKSSLLDAALDFTPVNVRMSAWYGEAGLRVIGSSRSAVRPYAEATAGIARLTPHVVNGGELGALTNAALAFLGQTDPLVGAGAGVIIQGGPLLLDVGYRYKRILANDVLSSAFALGTNGFEVSQARIGVGVRF